ncbi:MAG: hypothetical protein Ct9H300mP16_17580 [Pseudomonadota bacterium]|nr:MAG: hypothetical protein Ct9H300mP16_17580 [Pseudomonadota bacterium]
MELAGGMVKTTGTGPTIGPSEYRGIAMRFLHPINFCRRNIQRFIPGQLNKSIVTPILTRTIRTSFKPTTPD